MSKQDADSTSESSQVEAETGQVESSTLVDVLRNLPAKAHQDFDTLDALSEPERASVQKRTKKEKRDLDLERAEEELESAKQDRTERKRYASLIFGLICAWLVMLFAVLFFQGLAAFGFQLQDSVLLALIGGTTANVLGIFVIVAKYLFPSNK